MERREQDRDVTKMVYLASPYSHDDGAVRQKRFTEACRAASHLMQRGDFVFSPIAHTHPIALWGLPKGWDYWHQYDRWFLLRCERVVVLKLDGWRESVGVQAEIRIAESFGHSVEYMDPLPPYQETQDHGGSDDHGKQT